MNVVADDNTVGQKLKNSSNPDNIYDDTIYIAKKKVTPMLQFTFMMNLNHINGYVCYSNAELK